jgi:hypothetical protein
LKDSFAFTQHLGYLVSDHAEKFGVSGDFFGVSRHGVFMEYPESGYVRSLLTSPESLRESFRVSEEFFGVSGT